MNDVLKQFRIVFGINTKPLEMGLQRTESKLRKFGRVFSSIASTYFSYKIMQGVINGFAEFNTRLSHSTSLMGYNVENITAFGGALKRFGGDTQSVIASLNALNSGLHEAKFGGGALVEVAKRYGLTISTSNGKLMSAEQLLKSLSYQLHRYDKQTRVAIASQLGLDESIVRAFNNGSKGLQRLIDKQKQFGIITAKDVKISNNFNNAVLDLKDSFSGIVKMFSRFILPMLTKLFKLLTSFVEFMKKRKQFIIAFFSTLIIAMMPVLAILGKMALASAAAFAPIFTVVAIVSSIALVLEDIYYYFMGWDSVTEGLVKKFPLLAKSLEAIRPVFMAIRQAFSDIMDFLTDPSWDNFINIFLNIGKAIVEMLEKPIARIKRLLSDIIESVKGFIMDNAIVKFMFGDNSTPVVPTTNNTSTTNNNVQVTQNITSATPKALADETKGLLTSQINQQRQQVGGY